VRFPRSLEVLAKLDIVIDVGAALRPRCVAIRSSPESYDESDEGKNGKEERCTKLSVSSKMTLRGCVEGLLPDLKVTTLPTLRITNCIAPRGFDAIDTGAK
jgi:hypothetical protein